MTEKIIEPEKCEECTFFFLSKPQHICNLYNRAFPTIPSKKPDFCKLEKIVIYERE